MSHITINNSIKKYEYILIKLFEEEDEPYQDINCIIKKLTMLLKLKNIFIICVYIYLHLKQQDNM